MYKQEIDNKDLVNWQDIKYATSSSFYDGMNGTGEYVCPEL